MGGRSARTASARPDGATYDPPVGISRTQLFVTPRLAGRDAELEGAVAAAGDRPGVLVIAGPPGAGATRLAHELAARLALDGAIVIDAEGPPDDPDRVGHALEAEGHNPDPLWAARLRPLVVLAGDVPGGDTAAAVRLGRRLAGSRALVLMTAREVVPDVTTLYLNPIDSAAAHSLAADVAPELATGDITEIARLSRGLPGRVVAMAVAARRPRAEGAPVPIPTVLADPLRSRLEALDPWPRDIAGWLSVMAGPIGLDDLARTARAAPAWLERGLTALERCGLVDELPGPPEPRWTLADPLTSAVVCAALGPAETRRRYAAALVAATADADADPSELLRLASGAGDPAAALRHGIAAARRSRAAGDAERAVDEAGQALAWWSRRHSPDGLRWDAVHERGMALLDLSRFESAAESLERAAAGRFGLGRHDAALASITSASSAHWSLGRHDAALLCLQGHLDLDRRTDRAPTAALAEALTQAAGMAVMTSRFTQAMSLAGDAREVARRSRAPEVATRALIFMGMAESGLGGRGGLGHLARARREGRRATGAARRNETLAMIHQSHVLIAHGRPAAAVTVARAGEARARALGLVDHELVLAGNLGEALAARGELAEAQRALEGAAGGWADLGVDAPTPADPGLAWVELARGNIDAALRRYRVLTATIADSDGLFEQLGSAATGHVIAALAAGEPQEAASTASDAISAWRRTDDRLVAIPLLSVACETHDEALADAARGALEDLASEAPADSVVDAHHLYAEGQAAVRGRERDGSIRLREAAAAFDASSLAWWAARALLMSGAATHDRESAIEDLLGARTRFREMGAEGWSRRAEARLRAIGVRIAAPARRVPDDGAGLSAREGEVLDLLALGLRNRDIGERLFISDRTVARHLAQVYAKLGVSTRTEAVRRARERGLIPDPAASGDGS